MLDVLLAMDQVGTVDERVADPQDAMARCVTGGSDQPESRTELGAVCST